MWGQYFDLPQCQASLPTMVNEQSIYLRYLWGAPVVFTKYPNIGDIPKKM